MAGGEARPTPRSNARGVVTSSVAQWLARLLPSAARGCFRPESEPASPVLPLAPLVPLAPVAPLSPRADAVATSSTSLDALPPALLRAIFMALPPDSRWHCAAVCRAWRELLADASLWTVLDLSCVSNVAAALHGAAARGAGMLVEFILGDAYDSRIAVEVAAANAATLRRVRLGSGMSQFDVVADTVNRLMTSMPRLELLETGISGCPTDLTRFLDAAQGQSVVRANVVDADFITMFAPATLNDRGVLRFASAVGAHAWVRELRLTRLHGFAEPRNPELLNALLEAARTRRVVALSLDCVDLCAANMPALVRLLQCGSLARLSLKGIFVKPAEEHAAVLAQLCDALRGSESLTDLTLCRNYNSHVNRAVLRALPTLQALRTLRVEPRLRHVPTLPHECLAYGRLLAELLTADLPRLRTLDLSCYLMDDGGMAAVLDGLANNTHLRELRWYPVYLSEAFTRDHLAPALEALAARGASR